MTLKKEFRMRPYFHKKLLSFASVLSYLELISLTAWGHPIVDPFAPVGFRPQIDQAANSVPVVSIATPNTSGVSQNHWQEFDVDEKGLVFNNSTSDGMSVLAGYLNANPQLMGRSASVIVNEVHGTKASELLGTLEVFGTPAAVVISNPQGIRCRGCRFHHASEVQLYGKTLDWETIPLENTLETFSMEGDRLSIRSPIKTKKTLSLKGNTSVESFSPLTSGKISIEGGELTLSGDITSETENIEINATGDIDLQQADARKDLRITSAGELAIKQGKAGGTISLQGASIEHFGELESESDITLSAKTAYLSGAINAHGNFSLNTDQLENRGTIHTTKNATFNAQQFYNRNNIFSEGMLSLNADLLDNTGIFASAQNFNWHGNTFYNHDGGWVFSFNDVQLEGEKFSNIASTIEAHRDLTLHTADFENRRTTPREKYVTEGGLHDEKGNLYETWSQVESSEAAILVAGRDLNIDSNSGKNEASFLLAGRDIHLHGNRFRNLAHTLKTRFEHTYYRWKSKLLGTKEKIKDTSYSYRETPSIIQSGNAIHINMAEQLENTGKIRSQTIHAIAKQIQNGRNDRLPTGVLTEFAQRIALTEYKQLPHDPNALFTSPDTAQHSYHLALDNSGIPNTKLLPPDYLSQKMGVSIDKKSFLADPAYEQKWLRQAYLEAENSGALHLSQNEYEQKKKLYDNAAQFASQQHLIFGQKLTLEQQHSLEQPILWYEWVNLEGEKFLAPVLYLPDSKKAAPLAGGSIEGDHINLQAETAIDNTGFIVGTDTVELSTQKLRNRKRTADMDKTVVHHKDYWEEISGEAVQPGGFIAAGHHLIIDAARVESGSGEFQQSNQEQTTELKRQFGQNFVSSEVSDHIHHKVHLYEQDPLERLLILGIEVGISTWLGPAASGFLAAQGGSLFTAGGILNMGISSGITTLTSQTIKSTLLGQFDFKLALKNSLSAAITAGMNSGLISDSLQLEPLSKSLAEHGLNLEDVNRFALKSTGRALIRAGHSALTKEGSFGQAFRDSLSNDLASILPAATQNYLPKQPISQALGHATIAALQAELKGENPWQATLNSLKQDLLPTLETYGVHLEKNKLEQHLTVAMAAHFIARNLVQHSETTGLKNAVTSLKTQQITRAVRKTMSVGKKLLKQFKSNASNDSASTEHKLKLVTLP